LEIAVYTGTTKLSKIVVKPVYEPCLRHVVFSIALSTSVPDVAPPVSFLFLSLVQTSIEKHDDSVIRLQDTLFCIHSSLPRVRHGLDEY